MYLVVFTRKCSVGRTTCTNNVHVLQSASGEGGTATDSKIDACPICSKSSPHVVAPRKEHFSSSLERVHQFCSSSPLLLSAFVSFFVSQELHCGLGR